MGLFSAPNAVQSQRQTIHKHNTIVCASISEATLKDGYHKTASNGFQDGHVGARQGLPEERCLLHPAEIMKAVKAHKEQAGGEPEEATGTAN